MNDFLDGFLSLFLEERHKMNEQKPIFNFLIKILLAEGYVIIQKLVEAELVGLFDESALLLKLGLLLCQLQFLLLFFLFHLLS